jgi:hypothetical protein
MALNFPSSPQIGDTYGRWMWNGATWSVGGGVGGAWIIVNPTPPGSPTLGTLWFDGDELQVWDGAAWTSVNGRDGRDGTDGINGTNGTNGTNGIDGAPGATGAQGPPVNLTVGTTSTGAPGSNAEVSLGGTPPNQTLNITVPQGDEGPIGATGPPSIPAATANSPVMLAAANGAVNLIGQPILLRFGNSVCWQFQGTNKASNTANTISLAEIPVGFRPAANVTQAIQAPAGNVTAQMYTTGTNVFPDAPATNVTTGNTRWAIRFSAQLGASAAMSAMVWWQTNDPMPT